jgi:single-strand DNA-binding protein
MALENVWIQIKNNMSGLNKVQLIGRIGKDPEIKTFSNGGSIANFSIATSETWKDKTTGEKKESTEWHNISVNGPLVGVVEKYVHKGDQIYVEGKLKTRSWEKDGVTKYITEVIVRDILLLGGKPQTSEPNQRISASPVEATPPALGSIMDSDLPF